MIRFAKNNESISAEVSCPRIFGVKSELNLCPFTPRPRRILAIARPAKRPISWNQQAYGLIIVRLVFCRTLKKRGCPFKLPLGHAGTPIEVMSLKRIRVESDRSFEFRRCFVITLGEGE